MEKYGEMWGVKSYNNRIYKGDVCKSWCGLSQYQKTKLVFSTKTFESFLSDNINGVKTE